LDQEELIILLVPELYMQLLAVLVVLVGAQVVMAELRAALS
jgi:hypothetical protein